MDILRLINPITDSCFICELNCFAWSDPVPQRFRGQVRCPRQTCYATTLSMIAIILDAWLKYASTSLMLALGLPPWAKLLRASTSDCNDVSRFALLGSWSICALKVFFQSSSKSRRNLQMLSKEGLADPSRTFFVRNRLICFLLRCEQKSAIMVLKDISMDPHALMTAYLVRYGAILLVTPKPSTSVFIWSSSSAQFVISRWTSELLAPRCLKWVTCLKIYGSHVSFELWKK